MTMTETEHALDRFFVNVEHGRFERALSGLTAAAAAVTGAEVSASASSLAVGPGAAHRSDGSVTLGLDVVVTR